MLRQNASAAGEQRKPAHGRPGSKAKHFKREESLGYLLRSTERAFTRAFQARIEQEGMTIGMWYYLRALWEQDGVTQRELSQRVGTMDPSTGSALAKMERLGLIYRSPDATDRRKRYIFLTEKARNDRDRLVRHAVELQDFATAEFSPREEQRLRQSLTKLRERVKHDRFTGSKMKNGK
jgi:DNA-binding MarR family transcriptional regulator